ncbi:DUF397 domain-containing protein [Streptomyces sp. NPDC046716]|uniref:DUF397 domain-containing protein n=1 Tax=Streptomyces sp. NPDC046716 TaxID=3157093 RepID=UPI00340BD443
MCPHSRRAGHPGWCVRNRGRSQVGGSRTWRKSSASTSGGGNCVEVARTGTEVCVRDSKRRRGRIVTVTPAAWDSFLHSLSGDGDPDARRRATS